MVQVLSIEITIKSKKLWNWYYTTFIASTQSQGLHNPAPPRTTFVSRSLAPGLGGHFGSITKHRVLNNLQLTLLWFKNRTGIYECFCSNTYENRYKNQFITAAKWSCNVYFSWHNLANAREPSVSRNLILDKTCWPWWLCLHSRWIKNGRYTTLIRRKRRMFWRYWSELDGRTSFISVASVDGKCFSSFLT